jgi:hypothetical protein
MAKLHNVTITTKGLNGYFQIQALIKSYIAVLETAAGDFEADKSAGAQAAVAATVTFLMALNRPRRLLAPLVEAANIIKRDTGAQTLFEQRQERDILDSAIVSLHRDEGVKLEDAVKRIHDHDPGEAERLLRFRNNMKKSKSKGAREARALYHLLKTDFRRRYPKDTAARALRGCKAMRGKKG